MTAAQDDLFTLAKGYYVTKALLSLWRLGLLQRAIDGKVLDAELLSAEGYDRELLQALFDYLAVRGYLEFDPGAGYRLSERGGAASSYYGYLPMLVGAYEPVFSDIENMLVGAHVYGRDVSRSGRELAQGVSALEEHLLDRIIGLAKAAQCTRVLDLGCGGGRVLSKVCKLSDDIQGIGVDWDPEACEEARRTMEHEGLHNRVSVLQGDIGSIDQMAEFMTDGADLVLSLFIMHEILRQRSKAGVVATLKKIAGLLGDQGRLLMVEVSKTKRRDVQEQLLFIPEYELVHNFSGQQLAAQEAWEEMVGEAGMRAVEVAPISMCQAFCLVAEKTPANVL